MYALWYAPSDGVTYAGAWDGARWRVEVLGQGRGDMVVVDDIPYVATTACDAASCVVSYGWREDGVWVLREVHNTIGPISAPSGPSMTKDTRTLCTAPPLAMPLW